jgi:hypothetical protein
MKREKLFGILFIAFSLVILFTNLKFTGAVVGISSGSLNIIALVFLVVGSALFLHGNTLDELTRKMKQANPRQIRQIANEMGYHEGREVKEGWQVYNPQGEILTVIPRHNPSKGVRHNLIKTFYTGEPNFRKRYSD